MILANDYGKFDVPFVGAWLPHPKKSLSTLQPSMYHGDLSILYFAASIAGSLAISVHKPCGRVVFGFPSVGFCVTVD